MVIKNIARVLVVDTNEKEYKITMFDKMIHQLLAFSDAISGGNIDDQLLATPYLSYTIKDKVVTSVSKAIVNHALYSIVIVIFVIALDCIDRFIITMI